MARIRTIKPEFWGDEKMSRLDPITRLVYLGLISLADDAGRLLDNVKTLDGLLFPNTNDTCREALDTLARLSRITRYRVASGQSLIQIARWKDHQQVDRPSKYVLPGPEQAVETEPVAAPDVTPRVAKDSRDTRENGAQQSRDSRAPILDLGPRTMDHGPLSATSADREPRAADPPPKPRRTAPKRPATEPGGWPARFHALLVSRGKFYAIGKIGALLKAPIDRFGEDRVFHALGEYFDCAVSHFDQDPDFVTLPKFAENAGDWIARFTPKDQLERERRLSIIPSNGGGAA